MVDLDLNLSSGRIRARSWGADDAPLLLCVHGLSASLMGYAWLAPQLAGPERRVVAVDLRGRGWSDITGPRTYGAHAHAHDVLEAATALGAHEFDYAGWSMGALIGLALCELDAPRVRSLTLIDHAGRADASAVELIRKALARLDAVTGSPEEYVAAVRAASVIDPWSGFWDDFYRYDLEPTDDGSWSPRTSHAACLEDLEDLERMPAADLWSHLTMPVALVRALRPIGGGLIVPPDVRDAIVTAVAHLRLTEVDTDHYRVMTDPATLEAIRALL